MFSLYGRGHTKEAGLKRGCSVNAAWNINDVCETFSSLAYGTVVRANKLAFSADAKYATCSKSISSSDHTVVVFSNQELIFFCVCVANFK